MKILRVFPHKTSYTPDDDMVLIGHPALAENDGQIEFKETRPLPPHDEIHISCTFTWDMALCERLAGLYSQDTDKPVRLGGVAYGSPCDTFTPGLYVKQGVVFTSRGCNNNCSFCIVPKNEGKLKELPIVEGNLINDNNFLQCSREHKDRVFQMLKSQKGICFKGGLQSNLIDGHFIENIQSLKIKELWLACDSDSKVDGFIKAVEKLKSAGYTQEHIKCYALIGDDMEANEKRLQAIYRAGAMPFAQLYQPAERIEYSKDWKAFHRMWSRPAATRAHCDKGTDYKNYNYDEIVMYLPQFEQIAI